MLVLASMLIGAFIIYSILFSEEHIDDDDDRDGGMMIPVMIPTQ